MDTSAVYLGHPLIISYSDQTKAYNFIPNKFKSKLTTVKANKLNHVGHLAYINYVFASIPIYYMTNIIFTKKFLSKINAIIQNFSWAGIQEEQNPNPINLRFRKDMMQPKAKGGLGIKNMRHNNLSLMLNTAWRLIQNQDPYLLAIIKSKYYPNKSFWTPWCTIWEKNFMTTWDYNGGPIPNIISDLWYPNTKQWDSEKISQVFGACSLQIIRKIPIIQNNRNDILV